MNMAEHVLRIQVAVLWIGLALYGISGDAPSYWFGWAAAFFGIINTIGYVFLAGRDSR